MGVAKAIGYGVRITDEFGYADDSAAEEILKRVKLASLKAQRPLIWCFECPSAEATQYVLGVEAVISKTTDFMKLHEGWELAMTQAPDAVREFAKQHEPDVCFLAGKS